MRTFLVSLLVLFFLQPACSQKMNDVIYLHNGSIIRGNLTEQSDTLVRIMTCCGSVFAYKPDEVSRIARERSVAGQPMVPRKGYMVFTSFGVLVGSSEDQKSAPFSTLMEHNFRFNKWLALGGFMGFEQLNENVLPLGLNLRFLAPAARTDYFISGTCGYSVSLGKPAETGMEKARGGFMTGVETGFIIPLSRGSALTLAVGYRYNRLNYQLNDWWRGDYEKQITFNRFMVRFGICVF